MKKYAVIVAGGLGSRMGSAVPKQFLLLYDRPVLWYTLEVFLGTYADLQVILVVPEGYLEAAQAVVGTTQAPQRVRLTAGGATRFHSVQNGLELIAQEEDSVIFVHDGVRCLVSSALVHRCYEQATRLGSAIPVVDSKDSVRLVTDRKKDPTGNKGPAGPNSEAIDRSRVKLVQTPQTFLSNILLPSYRAGYREEFTDEATVVEAAGHKVQLIEGEVSNIKITTPIDMVVAEKELKINRGDEATGAGD